MTIYASNLSNDQDMIKALGSVAVPLPIDIGDCCFSGVGTNNNTLLVSVERKKVGDMAQCIMSGRYLSQAQTAKELGADVLVLILEVERVRPNPDDGVLETLNWGISPRTMRRCQVWAAVRPIITYSRFDQYLTELEYLAGVIVKRSHDVYETAAIIKALWANFQLPPDKHNSLHTIQRALGQSVQLVRPGLVRRVASELSGIGWERSRAVSEAFKSVREMANADVKRWKAIEGIEKKTAEKVVGEILGEQKNGKNS
jgi:ERCC4-type nuclease